MRDIEKNGPFAVVRDSKGNIVHKQLDKGSKKENWKHVARLVTNNGMDMLEKLISIGRGEVQQTTFTLPTGETMLTEPLVPPISDQRQAAKDVFEFIHGKAVAATEVVRAESEAEQMARLQSMSDDELRRLAAGIEDAELVEQGTEMDCIGYEPEEE